MASEPNTYQMALDQQRRARFPNPPPYMEDMAGYGTGGGGPMDPLTGKDYTDARIGEARAQSRAELIKTEMRLGDKVKGVEDKLDTVTRKIDDLASNIGRNFAEFKSEIGSDVRAINTRLDHTATKSSTWLAVGTGALSIVALLYALVSYGADRSEVAFDRGQAVEARLNRLENRVDPAPAAPAVTDKTPK